MRRFYTPLKQLKEGIKIYLPEEESVHITKSLRLSQGDRIEVFNGEETFEAEIFTAAKRSVRITLLKRLQNIRDFGLNNNVEISLFIALIKLNHLELAIQKTVELGISKIFVYNSKHVSVDPQIFNRKRSRLDKIAIEACKQSKYPIVPKIEGLISFKEMIDMQKDFSKSLLFTTEVKGSRLANGLNSMQSKSNSKLSYIIGPEGGFSDEEIEFAKLSNELDFAKFGINILKSETASIAILSVLQHYLNDY